MKSSVISDRVRVSLAPTDFSPPGSWPHTRGTYLRNACRALCLTGPRFARPHLLFFLLLLPLLRRLSAPAPRLGRLLLAGTFGQVLKVKHVINGAVFALKVIRNRRAFRRQAQTEV